MRVLHVYKSYFPDTQGGLEECIRQICRGTTARGVENRVLSLSRAARPDILERPEARVYRFPVTWEAASNGMSLGAWTRFAAMAEWADVIHYHFPWPFADLLHLWHRPRRATVLTYHSDIVRQRLLYRCYRPVMWRFLRQMDCIVATSPPYAATSPVLARLARKVRVIPIGLDEDSYPRATERSLAWARTVGGERFLLFIGVLRYYKGLEVLLEALAGTEVQLVIAGTGPLEHALRDKADRRGLRNIRFLGHVSDEEKVALIRRCAAVVLPSQFRSEAFGISLLEGAMYGRPLISTDIGTGTSYVNDHRRTGLVVPPGDRQALREAIMSLERNAQAAEEMGAAARLRYEQLFTGKRMCEAYDVLYQELVRPR